MNGFRLVRLVLAAPFRGLGRLFLLLGDAGFAAGAALGWLANRIEGSRR